MNGHADDSNGPETSVLLSADSCENGDANSNDSDVIARAEPSRGVIAATKQGDEGSHGDSVQAPSVSATPHSTHTMPAPVDLVHGNFGQKEEHGTCDVAPPIGSITASEDSTASGGVHVPTPTHIPSATQYSSPGASSPFHTEKFDFIPPMIRPIELTKTQKRKLEKKRAALKKKEAAQKEAARLGPRLGGGGYCGNSG